MTNTASLENCKRLFEVSGWEGVYANSLYSSTADPLQHYLDGVYQHPLYTAGFLLRKLKEAANREWSNGLKGCEIIFFWDVEGNDWTARFRNTDMDDSKFYPTEPGDNFGSYGHTRFWVTADTPEDALAKLAIALFEQGILIREVSA